MSSELVIEGTIEEVLFVSEETGYAVVRLSREGQTGTVTAVGDLGGVVAGEIVRCFGEWTTNRRFGEQFAVQRWESLLPATVRGIERYLGSGLIPGLGEVYAKRIVEKFGARTLDVISDDPKRLLDVEGIGPKRYDAILKSWREHQEIRNILVVLQSYGVSTTFAFRIYKEYENDALRIVRENPYRLAADIEGIGFQTADRIARHLGFDLDSVERAEAGVTYVLQQAAGADGHCYLPPSELLRRAIEVLRVDQAIIERGLARLIEKKAVVADALEYGAVPQGKPADTGDGKEGDLLVPAAALAEERRGWLSLEDDACGFFQRALYRAETEVATKMTILAKAQVPRLPVRTEGAIAWVEKRSGMPLHDEQKAALRRMLDEKVLIITGGPGTGKTTLVARLVAVLTEKKVPFALAAPTGRASKRLAEVTGAEAKTVHRLLEFSPKESRFVRDTQEPLDAAVLVVDEVSMIDVGLMHALLRAVPNTTRLILVGDVDQLPSVGPGHVLRDLIESHVLPTVRLEYNFRQEAGSRIAANAHRINSGQFPNIAPSSRDRLTDFYFVEGETQERVLELIKELVVERIPERFGFHPVNDIQVLAPIHKGPVGVENLNAELQRLLNPNGRRVTFGSRAFRIADKVMQIRNDYTKEVYNGDIGRVVALDEANAALQVDFDGRIVSYARGEADELVLAYAASIHKAQGCEYRAVVLPMVTQHYMLLQRNLLYTAVTRGKDLVVLVGSTRAINIAVKNDKIQRRYTRLAERLRALAVGSTPPPGRSG